MMKKALTILLILTAFSACSGKVEPELFSSVEITLSTPDGAAVKSMTVDPSLPGNKFLNLNTGINYPFPEFKDGKASLKVQKGVYSIAFDGKAVMEDGASRSLRSYSHSDPVKALNLLSGTESITLDVIYLY